MNGFSLAAVLAALTVVHQASTRDRVVDGAKSSVRLLAAAHTNERKDANGIQAPDGLVITVLVVRKPGARGLFTLTETRDFTLDGKSYRELTTAALHHPLEPMTHVFGPQQVHLPDGSTVAEKYGVDDSQAVVLTVTLYGAPFGRAGHVAFVVQAGWGNDTESFPFELDLKG